jgi:hypothetical protein
MQHPYLSFSNSATYSGCLVVGTSNIVRDDNGRTNKSVLVIEIPSTFDGKSVVEIGYTSFAHSNITSIFISKGIKYLNNGAFYGCYYLTEVRFEEESALEKIDYNVFYKCTSLTKINIPKTLVTVRTGMFSYNSALECLSYLGSTDFSSSSFFSTETASVKIHVASTYPSGTFGGRSVIKDDGTCGVSSLPFNTKTGSKANRCSIIYVNSCSPNYIKYVIFVLSS